MNESWKYRFRLMMGIPELIYRKLVVPTYWTIKTPIRTNLSHVFVWLRILRGGLASLPGMALLCVGYVLLLGWLVAFELVLVLNEDNGVLVTQSGDVLHGTQSLEDYRFAREMCVHEHVLENCLDAIQRLPEMGMATVLAYGFVLTLGTGAVLALIYFILKGVINLLLSPFRFIWSLL